MRSPALGRHGAAAMVQKQRFSPPQGYHHRPRPSTPTVLTPRGTTCPYRLRHIPALGLCLCKQIQGSRHFLRVPPAVALDISALQWAESEGARFARVEDTESGRVYFASLSTISAKGFPVNRGFGRQVGLALSLWAKQDPAQATLFGGMV